MKTTYIIASIVFFFLATFSTLLLRAYALNKSILDIPNERSSHTIPIPRGGGLSIVTVFYLGLGFLAYGKIISLHLCLAFCGGLIIAGAGYWDDHQSLRARWRVLLHFVAAIWSVYWLHGFPSLQMGVWDFHLNYFVGSFLAVLTIVWLVNLYNFMDGIDGLAGLEALFASLVGAIALIVTGSVSLGLLCVFLGVGCLGFLIFNYPPAKIFMGDVGSGFIGFIFGVFIFATANQGILSPLFWLVILSVFIADATYTLISRLLRKQALYQAHREHAYQCLVQNGYTHKRVALLITLANILIIAPLAYLIIIKPHWSFYICLALYAVLWIVWFSRNRTIFKK